MQVDSNLNSLMQLEKKLEQSTKELAKLNKNDTQSSNQEKNIKKDTKQQEEHRSNGQEPAKIKSGQTIPIAYSIDQNGISVQNMENQTVIDIKA